MSPWSGGLWRGQDKPEMLLENMKNASKEVKVRRKGSLGISTCSDDTWDGAG